jgi:MtN3 and saliva related transmembrane protein
MPPIYVEVVGYIGSFTLAFMTLPQIINTYKTKSAKDLSYGMLGMMMVGYSFFLTYGILIYAIPIISSISLSILNCSILISMKRYYDVVNTEKLPI